MKRIILPLLFFIGVSASAQTTINESDLPTNGASETLYVIDSAATDYSGVTGTGVTWDYSGYGNYVSNAKTITMTSISGNVDFPNATDSISIQDFTSSYYRHNADSLVALGFSFTEATAGDVSVTYSNEGFALAFPAMIGSSPINDPVSGNVNAPGLSMSSPHGGSIQSFVDGTGTLKLAQNDYSDVLRIKTIDSVKTTIPSIKVIRTTYEYRKPSESAFPLLIHTSVRVEGPVNDTYSIVHSAENPTSNVGINDNVQENIELNIYPNPANDNINVVLNSNATGNGTIEIYNTIGQQAKRLNFNASNKIQNINISELNKGIYFVRVQLGNMVVTKKITVL